MEYIYNYRQMRKLSLILLIACLASACIKETPAGGSMPGDSRAISFMTATYTPGTKTDPETYTGGPYDTGSKFGVYAFTLDNGVYGTATSREFSSAANTRYPDLMYNDGVAYDAGSTTWIPILRDFFWPKQDRVAFFAYSPFYAYETSDYSAADMGDNKAKGSNRRKAEFYTNSHGDKNKRNRFYHEINGVNLYDPSSVANGYRDVLFSDIALNFNDFADGSDTDVISNGTATSFNGVPIFFHHALCKVNFVAKFAYDRDEDGIAYEDRIKIYSIEGEQHDDGNSSDTKTPGVSGGNPQYTYDYSEDGKVVVTKKYWHTVVDVYTQKMTTTEIWGTNTYTGVITSLTLSTITTKGNLKLWSEAIADPTAEGNRSKVVQWDMTKSYWTDEGRTYHNLKNIYTNPANPPTQSPVTLSTAPVNLIVNKVCIPRTIRDDSTISLEYTITTDPEEKRVTTATTTTTITRQLRSETTKVYVRSGFVEAADGEDEPAAWSSIMADDDRNMLPAVDTELNKTVVVGEPVEDLTPEAGYNTALTFKTGDIPLKGLCGIEQWEMGKIYTYTINISPKAGQKINWDPAKVSEWTAGSATLDL